MASEDTFTESDEGKKVVDAEGKTVGRILEVTNGRAYVSPDPDYSNSELSKPEVGDRDDGTYAIESDRIAETTRDEVVLEPP